LVSERTSCRNLNGLKAIVGVIFRSGTFSWDVFKI
jgi:hypothetical protein